MEGGDFGRSVTHFSVSKAPKNGSFWKFLGIIELGDPYMAPQKPNILKNFGTLVKIAQFCESGSSYCIIMHQMTKNHSI